MSKNLGRWGIVPVILLIFFTGCSGDRSLQPTITGGTSPTMFSITSLTASPGATNFTGMTVETTLEMSGVSDEAQIVYTDSGFDYFCCETYYAEINGSGTHMLSGKLFKSSCCSATLWANADTGFGSDSASLSFSFTDAKTWNWSLWFRSSYQIPLSVGSTNKYKIRMGYQGSPIYAYPPSYAPSADIEISSSTVPLSVTIFDTDGTLETSFSIAADVLKTYDFTPKGYLIYLYIAETTGSVSGSHDLKVSY